jgi:hypothetical protein
VAALLGEMLEFGAEMWEVGAELGRGMAEERGKMAVLTKSAD